MNNNAIKIVLGIMIAVVLCTISIYAFFNINALSESLTVLSIDEVKNSKTLEGSNKYESNKEKKSSDVVQVIGVTGDWIYPSKRNNSNLYKTKMDYEKKQLVDDKSLVSEVSVKNNKIIYIDENTNKQMNIKNVGEAEYDSSLCKENVDEKSSFIVTFNKSVSEAFVNDKNIFILDSLGKKIDTKLSIEKDDKKIKVVPLEYFEKGEEYCLYIISSNGDKKNITPMGNIKIKLSIKP